MDRQLRAERRQLEHDIIVDQDVDMVDESVIVIDSSIEMLHVEEVETVTEKTTTQGVQTNAGPILLESSSQTGSDPLPSNRMTAAAYKYNPRGIQFYTGINNYVIFRDIFATLGPATTRFELHVWCSKFRPTGSIYSNSDEHIKQTLN